MKKTKEQIQASRERYITQAAKAKMMLRAESLFDYIDGLRYVYSLSMRYKSVNLKSIICSNINDANKSYFAKCLRCGILIEWKDTFFFNKEKAESLQQYILENSTN